MRLLNTLTLQVEDFYTDVPKYAILSHTWDKEEVSFQDIQDLSAASSKAGYAKVYNACVHARKYEFEWIWIDSCCINKESSAELSEAINSMYQYYEDSEVCYAYLRDASSKEDPRDMNSGFTKSRWFTRGWTLQELLAPSHVVFLDTNWLEIGTRWSLRDAISAITLIPVGMFEEHDIDKFSIAQRMSWAACRATTRPEDIAYCLMGIFGVSMSPIYGEGGAKAFMRLQQEIIKFSDDRSIFAWAADNGWEPRGLLARSPSEFRMSGAVGVSEPNPTFTGDNSSYTFGNNGLHIYLPLESVGPGTSEDSLFLSFLHCRSGDGKYISVYLQRTHGGRYIRSCSDELVLTTERPSVNMQELTVKEIPVSRRTKDSFRGVDWKAYIRLSPSARHYFTLKSTPGASFDKHTGQIAHDYSDSPYLEYRARHETLRGKFTVFMDFHNLVPRFKLITGSTLSPDPSISTLWNDLSSADRFTERLTDGGIVSLAVQMTGTHSTSRLLEIDYHPVESEANAAAITRPLLYPKLNSGFLVLERELTLREIFPPDPYARTWNNQTYVCIPPNDSLPNGFRVLAFQSQWTVLDKLTVYVAIGFRGSMPWTDIVLGDSDDLARIKDVWESYLDSGSRAVSRLRCENTASVVCSRPEPFPDTICTVTVEERTCLQLGSHILRLDMIHPEKSNGHSGSQVTTEMSASLSYPPSSVSSNYDPPDLSSRGKGSQPSEARENDHSVITIWTRMVDETSAITDEHGIYNHGKGSVSQPYWRRERIRIWTQMVDETSIITGEHGTYSSV
ncbi:hypothetical protein VKT23_008043 [Stygiomarasmius scandens]|uniref:Heterokaryon incompatibility domain-containing protein n=1 Tax=Marasmiellus scandens TaxID=2682957 RepID=A0ABR1JLN7_9AGAR